MEDGYVAKKNNKKVIALIPVRLNSRRLPAKALLPINKLPLIIHVYRRTLLSKLVDDAIICCDDKKIAQVAKKYNAKVLLTSKHHINGTDRISTLNITPIQQSEAGKETIIIFRDYETGAETSVRIVNNITEPASTLLSQGGQGAST